MLVMRSIKDIQHIYYINLQSREDRRYHIEKEIAKIPWSHSPTRWEATMMKSGIIGCSISHLKCLEMARTKQLDHILIIEDDIEFLNPTLFTMQLNAFLKKHNTWDVVLLAGNNMYPFSPVDETCIQVKHCLTTTAYLVKHHYYDTLIQNIKEGLGLLLRNPEEKAQYAIDKYWLVLQEIDAWFLIVPLSVVQREDYSDIEEKVTNFKKNMLNYNKAYKNIHL